ncbi:MAG TPA: excinuclease ABC subunit UvrC, partial [Clostridiaceae bacterium]|nr:excinuclease ABC subunit UvrC [Clostridiaceae bacterium]
MSIDEVKFDARLDLVPEESGVYLMKDKAGSVIYVGKANNLRQRLASYFTSHPEGDAKVLAMISHIADFDFLICQNELEALILEANLIKQFKPRYNILLRDDREYPYIHITLQETYPRILKSFRVGPDIKDGARYFGPYLSGDIYRALEALRQIFPIKTCRKVLPRDIGKERPCLNYYIGRCIAPCKGDVSAERYREVIDDVVRFLEGKYSELLVNLTEQMNEAAANLSFEQAALLRDRIEALDKLRERQIVVSSDRGDRDVLGLARNGSEVCLQKLEVREGRVNSHVQTFAEDGSDTDASYLEAFISQHYTNTTQIPQEILLPVELDEQDLMASWLSELAGHKVRLHRAQRGTKRRLLEMAEKNAQEALQRYTLMGGKSATGLDLTLKELARLTASKTAIQRIEAYDISNVGASDRAGSMVVFQGGRPERSSYRHFSIASFEGIDDYSAMYEVIARRLQRLEDEEFGRKPDLILVDGGIGHVNKIAPLITEDIALAGIVKDERHRTRGLVLTSGEVIELRSDHEPSFLSDGGPSYPSDRGSSYPSDGDPSFLLVADRKADMSIEGAAEVPSTGETGMFLEGVVDIPAEADTLSESEGETNMSLEKGAEVPSTGETGMSIEGVAEVPAGADALSESEDEASLEGANEQENERALRMGLLRLLTAIQDEAHRFARRLSSNKHKRRQMRLLLEDIPGVGPATRRKLLECFNGLQGIAAASLEELSAVPGIPTKTA